jgi:hypothetical protein
MKIKTTNFLISLLLCFMFSAVQLIAQNIIYVTDDLEEENMAFLERQGFNVTPFWTAKAIGTVGQDTIDMFNAADLVIIGRSGPSTSFQAQDDKDVWNGITAPVLLICQWKARSSRLNWFNSTTIPTDNDLLTVDAKISDPTDPIFANSTIAADSTMDWFETRPHDFMQISPATNPTSAEVVASYNDSSILIARFTPNVPFYPGATDSAAGPRTYMGYGTGSAGEKYFFPLTKNAKAVYLAEICTMMGIPVQAPVFANIDYNIVFVSDDLEEENMDFLTRQGFNVEQFWQAKDINLVGEDSIKYLNHADLLIFGRSGPSSSFQDSAERVTWNALTAPAMLICPWKARNTRLRFFNSGNAYHSDYSPEVVRAAIANPADPIFANADIAADNTMDWFAPPPHDFIQFYPATTTSNAEIVATYNDSSVLIARFDANVRFYDETPDSAAGPRTYIGMGNDNLGWPNFFPLTNNAKSVYLAEIYRLMGLAVQEPVLAAEDYRILFATPNDRDSLHIQFLEAEGFKVTQWYPEGGLMAEPATTFNMMNAYNLVICGRATASSDFDGVDKYAWNKKVEVPLIHTSAWAARSTRINWFRSGSCGRWENAPGDTIYIKAEVPDDPVFDDAVINAADSMMEWSVQPESFLILDSAGWADNNWTIMADSGNAVVFARIDPCVEFYDGAGAETEKAAAPRVLFGLGNDHLGWDNFFPLTDNSKTVLLNEVYRLLTEPYAVCTDYPADDATLASLTVDIGELAPAFDPAVTEYKVMVPQGTDTVLITAVANDANADTVTGTGKVGLVDGIVVAPVTVTAEDTYTKLTYNVMIQTALIVDGVIGDGEWDWVEAMPVEKDIDIVNIADENDYSLYFKMLWNDSSLYLLIDVMDDAVYLDNVNVYQDDNLEIYFDMNNSKIQKWPRNKGWSGRPWTQMDDNDMQLRIQPTVDDVLYESNLFGTTVPNTVVNGITFARTESGTGYIFEMMFDFDSLAVGYPQFDAEEGTEIGFDIDASDNDGNPDYRDQVGWNADDDLIYTDACLWGTLQFNADGTVTQILDGEAPTAPANLAAVVADHTVTLTWDASTDNLIVDEYVIYVDGIEMGRVMAQETDNGGAVPDIPTGTYTVGVSAVDPSGNESDASEIEVDVPSGLDETAVSYSIYPVPASDLLIIENADLIERIEVFDLVGESIMNVVVKAKYVKLNTSDLKPGVYVIKLHTAGEVFTEQLVIE